MKVTLVANAGVLIEGGGEKLLIDALFAGGTEGFSAPPDGAREAMLAGRPPFDGVNGLLYTHDHPDHFDAALNEAFLARPRVRGRNLQGVVAPAALAAEHPAFVKMAEERSERLYLLDFTPGLHRVIHLGEVTLTAFASPHAGAQFAGVAHYFFLLETGGKSLLLLADSDYLPEYFAAVLAGRRVDAALVNPLFLNKAEGRRVVTEGVCPGRLLVYHLPFEGEDSLGLRKVAAYDRERYGDTLPPVELLLAAGQTAGL